MGHRVPLLDLHNKNESQITLPITTQFLWHMLSFWAILSTNSKQCKQKAQPPLQMKLQIFFGKKDKFYTVECQHQYSLCFILDPYIQLFSTLLSQILSSLLRTPPSIRLSQPLSDVVQHSAAAGKAMQPNQRRSQPWFMSSEETRGHKRC